MRKAYAPARSTRHLLLALVGATIVSGAYYALGFSPESWTVTVRRADDDVWRLSLSAAYTSLCFLALALAIGPWRVLTNRPRPLSMTFRRDIGIWAGIAALGHLTFSLFSHARTPFVPVYELWRGILFSSELSFTLEIWKLFFWGHAADPSHWWHAVHPRLDWFGIAAWLGVVQAGIVIMLLCTSNNKSLRALGPKLWKNLHRLTYALWISIGMHAFTFQMLENRALAMRVIFWFVFMAVVGLHIAAFVKARGARTGPGGAARRLTRPGNRA